MAEGRFSRIREQADSVILDNPDHVRITNEQVAVTLDQPFVNTDTPQERGLTNDRLKLFYNIRVYKEEETYIVKIDYGTIGTKCKVPIIGKYSGETGQEAAIRECNSMMRNKYRTGYHLQYAK
jgi:hypothetical protein